MKITNNLTSVTSLLSILLCLTGRGLAESYSAEELQQRAIHRRAMEAIIWGIPLVNYDLMFQSMVRDAKGGMNQILYWSGLADWKNQYFTPNPDTIYFMPFFSTKGVGPLVLVERS
jgi:hypothetical protein